LVHTVDLGVDARKALTTGQIRTIAAWRDCDEDATTATCRHEAVRLARHIRTLEADLASNLPAESESWCDPGREN